MKPLIASLFLFALTACSAGVQTVTLTGSLDSTKPGVANVTWDGSGHIAITPATVVYLQDFNTGADWWLTSTGGNYGGYGGPPITHVVDWFPEGYLKSWSAVTDHLWFADMNHTCYSPFYTLVGTQPCTWPKAMAMWKRVDGQNGTPVLPAMNLNGATLTVRIKGSSDHPNPNLYFLALASYTDSDGVRHGAEYFDEVHPMPLLAEWHTYSFRLEPGNFRCLGGATWPPDSAPHYLARNDMYNCGLTASQVLAEMNTDIELIFTNINPAAMVQGEVYLDSISVVR